MELSFLLTMIGLLGGLWVFLYRTITEATATSFDYSTQLALAFIHYVVFCYLALTLIVFFYKGMTESTEVHQRRTSIASALILETWPVTFVALSLIYCVSRLSSSDTVLKAAFFTIGLASVGYQIYKQRRHEQEGRETTLKVRHTLRFYTFVALTIPVYIPLMSLLAPDVRITTDKEFYLSADPVIMSVRTGGYIFQPEITAIHLGSFERSADTNTNDITSVVTSDKRGGGTLIEVDYKPQIFGYTKKAFHELKIVTNH